jgi:GWxTD domain-containing protein
VAEFTKMKIAWDSFSTKILFGILLISSLQAYGQEDISSQDMSLKYNPKAEAQISARVIETRIYQVYLRITFINSVIFDDTYEIKYGTLGNYDQERFNEVDSLSYESHGIWTDNKSYVLKFVIEKGSGKNILVIYLNDKKGNEIYNKTLLLNHEIIFPHPEFYLTDHRFKYPVFENYISPQDTLIIRDLRDSNATYFIYYYVRDFEVADPPMYFLDRKVSRELTIDSIFSLQTGQSFYLERKGFYFIQKDTSGFIGVSIRVQDKYYPRFVSIDDLYDPVIYLSTTRESQKLYSSEEKKRAFDQFWLSMANSPDQAKKIIREYYQQVEEANLLFTGYKEGWKTDMGMLYIILGSPDMIYNNGFTEEWYYSKREQLPGINFTFTRIKNLFARNHYVLLRKEQYKNYWYQVINEWRSGLK